jgi:hypothetical protein
MHKIVGSCTLWGKTLLQFSFSFVSFLGGGGESSHPGNNPTKKKEKKREGGWKSGGANVTKDFILKRNETQVAIL